MDDIIPFLLVPLILGAIVFGISWTFRRSRQMLEEWAASCSLELASAEFCWFQRGPFFWTTSKNQTVYRITVIDDHGDMRSGWARCGSFWWGLFTNTVEVRWDEN